MNPIVSLINFQVIRYFVSIPHIKVYENVETFRLHLLNKLSSPYHNKLMYAKQLTTNFVQLSHQFEW